jgi:hypothetical protein
MAAPLLTSILYGRGSLSSAGSNWQGSEIRDWRSAGAPSGPNLTGPAVHTVDPCEAERALAATQFGLLLMRWRLPRKCKRPGAAVEKGSRLLHTYGAAHPLSCESLVQRNGYSGCFRTPRACDDVGGHAVIELEFFDGRTDPVEP